MPKNVDGTVTTKTTGKVSSTPSGSGTGVVRPVGSKSSARGSMVVKVPGRGAVGRSARTR